MIKNNIAAIMYLKKTTFTGLIDGNGGATIDNIQIGVTGDNEIDTSYICIARYCDGG